MPRLLSLHTLIVLLVGWSAVGLAPADESIDVDWNAWRSINHAPLSLDSADWQVVCFLGVECPLARLYGPRLRKLDEEFAEQGVCLIGVNSNPQDSLDEILQYATDHELAFPIVKDSDQSLARQFGARRTPEVFVLDAAGRVRYRGRIDDQYEPGIARSQPTRHDLREALGELLAGRDVSQTRTEAAGCLITFLKQPRQSPDRLSAVTFTRDVAPILNRHCVECHREGEIGPFSLTEYDEVVGWGEMMLEVIEQNRMPPWHADPRHGKFVGARKIREESRATLAAWVEQGMPAGDPDDLPPQPRWSAGWHLASPPDTVLRMRDRPFTIPPEGTVDYQYFVVDPQWDEDRWIHAAQVIPGNASVVHHAIVFVRPPDGSYLNGIGWLGAYVPGQRTAALPPRHARRIPARSKLVFQMHYTPNGRVTNDVTRVGVWFGDPDDVTHEVTTQVALNHHFEIPPGAADYVVGLRLENFPRESRLLGGMPHMHLRGRSFRLDIRRGAEKETLLSVPKYDFNWQHWYQLQTPLALDDVDSLEMQVRFDNSVGNPTNPDPAEYVTWGDQTWQEMAVAFFDVAHPRGKPRVFARQVADKDPREVARQQRRIDEETDRFLAQMDRNGDGIVDRDEAPEAFRRFGFYQMDHNRDDRLDRSEIEIEAARRL